MGWSTMWFKRREENVFENRRRMWVIGRQYKKAGGRWRSRQGGGLMGREVKGGCVGSGYLWSSSFFPQHHTYLLLTYLHGIPRSDYTWPFSPPNENIVLLLSSTAPA